MSDDWVKHYIQDRTNKQRKADMAAAGAPGVFQKIQDRIKQDIQAFHDDGLFLSLQAEKKVIGKSFGVSSSDPLPHVSLLMRLNVVLINYGYAFEKDGRSSPGDTGSLKICADLEGNLQVYRDGEPFATESDFSEVSEFLLRPLLKHIDALRRH